MKAKNQELVDRYNGLLIESSAKEILYNHPEEWLKNCNGVGSTVGWARIFYNLIPNTIWFMDITKCSDIHDNEYVFPSMFADRTSAEQHRLVADLNFKTNCHTLNMWHSNNSFVRFLRERRIEKYYMTLRTFAEESFFSGKIILNEF